MQPVAVVAHADRARQLDEALVVDRDSHAEMLRVAREVVKPVAPTNNGRLWIEVSTLGRTQAEYLTVIAYTTLATTSIY